MDEYDMSDYVSKMIVDSCSTEENMIVDGLKF